MLFETAGAKAVWIVLGGVLVFAGASGAGTFLVAGLQAEAVDPLAAFERLAPNFLGMFMGMYMIYRIAFTRMDKQSETLDRSIERLGDRLEAALAGTVMAHSEAAKVSGDKRQMEKEARTEEMRQIRKSLDHIREKMA